MHGHGLSGISAAMRFWTLQCRYTELPLFGVAFACLSVLNVADCETCFSTHSYLRLGSIVLSRVLLGCQFFVRGFLSWQVARFLFVPFIAWVPRPVFTGFPASADAVVFSISVVVDPRSLSLRHYIRLARGL